MLLAEGHDTSREKAKAKLRAPADTDNTYAAIADEYCEKSSPYAEELLNQAVQKISITLIGFGP